MRLALVAGLLTLGLASPAFAQRDSDSGMICPGDARCPASSATTTPAELPAVDMAASPTHVSAPAAPPTDFAPAASEAGVADGQLESRTFDSGGVQLTVTSNTPVPNPTGRASGRHHH